MKNFLSIKRVEMPPPVFTGGGFRLVTPVRLFSAAVAAAAALGAAAVSNRRSRRCCANHGQGSNNHQKVLH